MQPKEKVKDILLLFFKLQGDDGNIVDGFIDKNRANAGYQYRYSALAPGWAAHKNTVETDQESSLLQAVKKYIDVTGDTSILTEEIGGQTVMQRMEAALTYLLQQRWNGRYGLVTGATTMKLPGYQPSRDWKKVADGIRRNVRKYL
jgi:hypothetical protein